MPAPPLAYFKAVEAAGGGGKRNSPIYSKGFYKNVFLSFVHRAKLIKFVD
jgi:hypothetical protein